LEPKVHRPDRGGVLELGAHEPHLHLRSAPQVRGDRVGEGINLVSLELPFAGPARD